MKRVGRRFRAAGAILILSGGLAGPAAAAGFFETLFGPPPMQTPPPAPIYRVYPGGYSYGAEGPIRRVPLREPTARRPPREARRPAPTPEPRHPTEKDIAATKCCATPAEAMAALARDATLRDGDLVMTPTGLKAFVGGPGDRHKPRDFAAATSARARQALGALARADAHDLVIRRSRHADAEARTVAAVAAPSETIESRGRLLRVIGGYEIYPSASVTPVSERGPVADAE